MYVRDLSYRFVLPRGKNWEAVFLLQEVFKKFADVNIWVWGALIALVLFGVILFITFRNKQRWTTRMLVHAAMCIALSFVLSCIRLYRMPQGGSITPASTLPIMLFAYVYGFTPGVIVGMAYGMLQLLQDLYFVHPMQLLLDYPLAFAMLALSGLLREWKAGRLRIAAGCVLGGLGRIAMHTISGAIFFAEYAGDLNPWIYSLGYNFISIGIDMAICAVITLVPPVTRWIENWRKATLKPSIRAAVESTPERT